MLTEGRASSGDMSYDQGRGSTDTFKRGGKRGGKRVTRFDGISSRRWGGSSRGGITAVRIVETTRWGWTWTKRGRWRGLGRRGWEWLSGTSGVFGRFRMSSGACSRDDLSIVGEITDRREKVRVIFGIGGREKQKVREIGAKEGSEFGGKGG